MRDLAKVSRIDNLTSVQGKDRIELATVNNYPVIVPKGDYQVGDLVVYVFYDTVLPLWKEFEFLKARCYSNLYNGYRIKNLKMCGVYSSGIVFNMDILPNDNYKLGDDVTEALQIQKYDPELLVELGQMSPNSIKKQYPSTVRKSDETNIEKTYGWLKGKYPDEEYYLTEKMEGQAGTWLLNKDGIMEEYSHNCFRDTNEDNTWTKVANKYNIKEVLRTQFETWGERLAIQGEICGQGIQSNIYGFKELKLFVYKITNVDTGKAYNHGALLNICDVYDLPTVPLLGFSKLLDSVESMLVHCEGNSIFGKNVKREGVVWRSVNNQEVGCKCKSRSYQAWFAKKDKTL